MNLSWIDDFMALAASGNFSRAAQERHMTQPAFSRRIRALEEWLGVELFDRSTQPARVTEVGEWFRTVAQDLRTRVDGIPGQARVIAEAGAGTLRFAATHALSFTFLPRWLQALEGPVTLGRLQLVSDVQQRCEMLLAQDQVQFMLAHGHPDVRGPLDDAGCEVLVVGGDRLLPVSAPAAGGGPLHALGGGAGPGPTQWLAYSPESGLGRILRALKGPALDGLPSPPVLTAHLASVLRTMALAGRGLAWLPGVLVGDDLASGRLVPAAPQDWSITLQVRLVRRRGPAGAAAEALWQAARQAGPLSPA